MSHCSCSMPYTSGLSILLLCDVELYLSLAQWLYRCVCGTMWSCPCLIFIWSILLYCLIYMINDSNAHRWYTLFILLFWCFLCLPVSVCAIARIFGTQASNQNGHPYQKLRTLKKLQLFIEFPCIQLSNLKFLEFWKSMSLFNLLKMKRNLLYIRNRFVLLSKHFPPQL